MTMTTTNDSGRVENTTACLPIAYGSIAFYLGKKSDEYHTHRWTLYVRSPDNQNNSQNSGSSSCFDLSRAISKVVFQLHPSFPQPTRELNEPPFEVTETGWGEFEASIRIVWKEIADERSTILTHGIRLYPNKAPATSADPSAYMNTSVPVVAEKYDEVVFTNPKAIFHQSLLNGHTIIKDQQQQQQQLPYPLSNEPSVSQHFRTYGDEEDVKVMIAAKNFLEGELRTVKDRLLRVDAELDEVKYALAATKDSMEAKAALAAAAGGAGGGGALSGGGGGGANNGGGGVSSSSSSSGGNAKGGGTGGGKSRSKSKKKASSASDNPHSGKKTKTA